ncbi:hypothetical protein FE257_003461 [Aspergillus nanangensis]|uniref:Short chain oxidoreductase/dehydrogenase n=1 Tax=Aspergillus nanangensis TaxID=2582783 RepID=A0AAD4CBZ8_ASPNN|nr:hypothetical protein FE257_003461 [Aspergillus nanangensis]
MDPLVWLITGASSGFGHSLALYALSAGHHVIATMRSLSKSQAAADTIIAKGGKVLELDVTSPDLSSAAKDAESFYGRIDVLVNNAGYSLLGAVEDVQEHEINAQFATNFFGPLRLIRALLPSMRAHHSGTIVNITSVAGQDGIPSCGLYAASKFALEGLSESLALEVAPFGISVLIVEPGAFRTNFLEAVQKPNSGLSEHYVGTPVDVMVGKFDQFRGKQPGDPEKGVARIFEAVTGTGMAGHLKGKILRLPLGPDCVTRMEAKVKSVTHDIEASREVACGTNFD